MKNLLSIVTFWLVLSSGALAQSSPNIGGAMLPNTGALSSGAFVSSGFSLLSKSGVGSPITGTGTETILATIAIPPNLIGANGQIRIRTYWTTPNNADTKTLRIRLGTTGITATQISIFAVTTFNSPFIVCDLQNTNATNAQNEFSEGTRGTDGLVNTILGSSAVDMTVAENIYLTGQLGTTTDTITLTGYSVEYAN